MEAGSHSQIRLRAMRSQRNVVRLGQRSDLFHLRNSAGISAVGLNNVDGVFSKIREDSPDRAIAFAAGQRNFYLLLEALKRLDVSWNGRLFQKEKFVRLHGGGELNQRGGGHRAMRVEH